MKAFHLAEKRWRNTWARRSSRERVFLSVGAALLAAALAWGAIWQPAQEARTRLARRNAALEIQVAQIGALARDAATLRARSQAPGTPEQMKTRLETALATLGLKPGTLEVDTQNRQARVSLEAPFDRCIALLDTVRRDSRWPLTQARFEATAQTGLVRAQLSWSQP
jgi:type II secretory pathway component PulM